MTLPNSGPCCVRTRMAVYAVLLVSLGIGVCFPHLDRGMLIDDESAFGITTDIMLETGDWVVPSLGTAQPHLNATPLFNWLGCLTDDCFADSSLKYRVWSAVFAVLCALAVLLLGAELFRPEVGFLAGVLLLTNHHFLYEHGARCGVMEPGLMLFLTLMPYCYLRTFRPGANPITWWMLTGATLGGAIMMKPPAMGGFFFGLIGLHHLFARRDLAWREHFTRPLLALAVATLIALPWYALIYQRLGFPGLKILFYDNSIRRVTHGTGRHYQPPPYWLYLDFLWGSARSGLLFWPSLAFGACCVVVGWLRFAWSLPTLLAGAYVAAISLATVKNPHYVYCAVPFLCVLSAAALLIGWLPRPQVLGNGRFGVAVWRVVAVVGLVSAMLFVRTDLRRNYQKLHAPAWEYPPLMVYRAAESHLANGSARFVLFGDYPHKREETNANRGFGSVDRFYRPRLSQAEQLFTLDELKSLRGDARPAVVFLPPRMTPAELAEVWFVSRPDRVVRLRTQRSFYTVLLYHDAEAVFQLTEFLKANEVPNDELCRF